MNTTESSTRPVTVADRRLAGLGVVGSSGFVGLLALLHLVARCRWPTAVVS